MEKQTLFEIHQQSGESFTTTAELYTPDGYFVKCLDQPDVELIDYSGNAIEINGNKMWGNTIEGFQIGLWVKKNGSFSIGANL